MENLRQLMYQGEVKFQYTKKDGSTRTAIGTLNETMIDECGGTPKGTGEAPAGTFPAGAAGAKEVRYPYE